MLVPINPAVPCPPGIPNERRTMDIQNIERVTAFTTKDGSEIRELLAPRNSCIRQQSLAEARLLPGARTTPHYHPQTEEIYYLLEGAGRMQIDGESRDVKPGDAIAIPPGAVHTVQNTGSSTLKFLCCCAPGYEDADTVLVETSEVRTRRAE
jgi:mannose-6-phosphate isomerase-like protein (cupin superfamily)